VLAFVTASCAAHASPRVVAPVSQVATGSPKQVLAFYYGWYGRPDSSGSWVHWSGVNEAAQKIRNATDYPVLGAYDSHDAQVVEQHCRWAKAAGLTGFVVSWWRRDDFNDQGMTRLLDTAQNVGLHVSAYIEQIRPADAPTVASATQDILDVLERHAGHPAWLRAAGKPVIFVYARAIAQLSLQDWSSVVAQIDDRYPGGALLIADRISPEAARVFGGIHTYNPTGLTAGKPVDEIRAWAHAAFAGWIETAGSDRIACVTVIAGYDDTTQGRPAPRPITDRHDGATYRALWEEALAANPDWILISSWNEWHEGTEIEPSIQNGDRELKTTAEFAPRFLAAPPRTPSPLTRSDGNGHKRSGAS
jgi:hypothetical protein